MSGKGVRVCRDTEPGLVRASASASAPGPPRRGRAGVAGAEVAGGGTGRAVAAEGGAGGGNVFEGGGSGDGAGGAAYVHQELKTKMLLKDRVAIRAMEAEVKLPRAGARADAAVEEGGGGGREVVARSVLTRQRKHYEMLCVRDDKRRFLREVGLSTARGANVTQWDVVAALFRTTPVITAEDLGRYGVMHPQVVPYAPKKDAAFFAQKQRRNPKPRPAPNQGDSAPATAPGGAADKGEGKEAGGVPPAGVDGDGGGAGREGAQAEPEAAVQVELVVEGGARYEGEAVQGVAQGRGRLTFSSGDVYAGEFVRGVMHGAGEWMYARGAYFRGAFANGVAQGEGHFHGEGGEEYRGDFAQNLPHGKGVMWWPNGSRYEGEWKRGRQHGFGSWSWQGNAYEGGFRDGQPHGSGRLCASSGDVYIGEWFRGKQHGRGALFGAKGRVHDGVWRHGKASGAAVLVKGSGGGSGRGGEGTGIGEHRRLVVGVWRGAEEGEEGEEDTLAEVEARVARKEACARFASWVLALARGEEAEVEAGVGARVHVDGAGGGEGEEQEKPKRLRGGVELSDLAGRGSGDEWRKCVGLPGSPWQSDSEQISVVEAVAMRYLSCVVLASPEGHTGAPAAGQGSAIGSSGGRAGGDGCAASTGVDRLLRRVVELGFDSSASLIKAIGVSCIELVRWLITTANLTPAAIEIPAKSLVGLAEAAAAAAAAAAIGGEEDGGGGLVGADGLGGGGASALGLAGRGGRAEEVLVFVRSWAWAVLDPQEEPDQGALHKRLAAWDEADDAAAGLGVGGGAGVRLARLDAGEGHGRSGAGEGPGGRDDEDGEEEESSDGEDRMVVDRCMGRLDDDTVQIPAGWRAPDNCSTEQLEMAGDVTSITAVATDDPFVAPALAAPHPQGSREWDFDLRETVVVTVETLDLDPAALKVAAGAGREGVRLYVTADFLEADDDEAIAALCSPSLPAAARLDLHHPLVFSLDQSSAQGLRNRRALLSSLSAPPNHDLLSPSTPSGRAAGGEAGAAGMGGARDATGKALVRVLLCAEAAGGAGGGVGGEEQAGWGEAAEEWEVGSCLVPLWREDSLLAEGHRVQTPIFGGGGDRLGLATLVLHTTRAISLLLSHPPSPRQAAVAPPPAPTAPAEAMAPRSIESLLPLVSRTESGAGRADADTERSVGKALGWMETGVSGSGSVCECACVPACVFDTHTHTGAGTGGVGGKNASSAAEEHGSVAQARARGNAWAHAPACCFGARRCRGTRGGQGVLGFRGNH